MRCGRRGGWRRGRRARTPRPTSWVTWTAVSSSRSKSSRRSVCSRRRRGPSSEPSGSSRRSTLGRVASARASATRCASPPESVVTSRCSVPASPTSSSASPSRAPRARAPARRRPWGRSRRSPRRRGAGTAPRPGTRGPTPRRCAGNAGDVDAGERAPGPSRAAPGRPRLGATVDLPDPLGPSSATRSPRLDRQRESLEDPHVVDGDRDVVEREPHRAAPRTSDPLRDERDGGHQPHEHDAERHRRPDVVLAGTTEEAEDRHGHRRPVGRARRTRSRRTRRARRRTPGPPRRRAGARAAGARSRVAPAPASRRGRSAASRRRTSTARRAGTSARTTNGRATSACATGTIAGDDRRSRGGSANASRNPKPSMAAEAPSGSMRSASSARRPPATATAAGIPTASAIAVAAVAKSSELRIACHGATRSAGVSPASAAIVVEAVAGADLHRADDEGGERDRQESHRGDDDRCDGDALATHGSRCLAAARLPPPSRRSSLPDTSTAAATAASCNKPSTAAVRRSKLRTAWL